MIALWLHKTSIDMSNELYSLFLLYGDYAKDQKTQNNIRKTMGQEYGEELQQMAQYPYRIDVIAKMEDGDRVDIGPYIWLHDRYDDWGDFIADLQNIDWMMEWDEAKMLTFFIESCDWPLHCKYSLMNEEWDVYIGIACGDTMSNDAMRWTLKRFAARKQWSWIIQDRGILKNLFSLI